jgi:hypothetical protein
MHAMKTYGGVKVCLHLCLTSTLDVAEWQISSPENRTPRTKCMQGWVGLRAGLDTVGKRKTF